MSRGGCPVTCVPRAVAGYALRAPATASCCIQPATTTTSSIIPHPLAPGPQPPAARSLALMRAGCPAISLAPGPPRLPQGVVRLNV